MAEPTRPDPPRHLQMALFGPPVVETDPEPALEDETREEISRKLDEAWTQMDLFIDGFPADQRAAALNGFYIDGDGRFRTTHQLLRAV